MSLNIFSGVRWPFVTLVCRTVYSDQSHLLKLGRAIPFLRRQCKPDRGGRGWAWSSSPTWAASLPTHSALATLASTQQAGPRQGLCMGCLLCPITMRTASASARLPCPLGLRASTPGPFPAHLKTSLDLFFFLLSDQSWKNWAPDMTTPFIAVWTWQATAPPENQAGACWLTSRGFPDSALLHPGF